MDTNGYMNKNIAYVLTGGNSQSQNVLKDFKNVKLKNNISLKGQIYFGELTFSPECGFSTWDPVELDFKYGKLIDLNIAKSFLKSKQKI